MPGYSQTPLSKKLGIKPRARVKTKWAPPEYLQLLEPLPENVTISPRLRKPVDIWHLFTSKKSDLVAQLPRSISEIRAHGMIWISWPKKSSGVESDITEDVIRAVALPLGIVDIKVCAVDEIWSGLKMVVRKEHRMKHSKKYGF